jgi:hypothetical protein
MADNNIPALEWEIDPIEVTKMRQLIYLWNQWESKFKFEYNGTTYEKGKGTEAAGKSILHYLRNSVIKSAQIRSSKGR